MARSAETYRAARKRRARESAIDFQPLTVVKKNLRSMVVLMPPPKVRPIQPKGWDWRLGGRRERDAARSPIFAAIAAEMRVSVPQALRVAVGGA
jgi:hypothetical protein